MNGQGSKARLELWGRAGRQDPPPPTLGRSRGGWGSPPGFVTGEPSATKMQTSPPSPHRSASGGSEQHARWQAHRQAAPPREAQGLDTGHLLHPAPAPQGAACRPTWSPGIRQRCRRAHNTQCREDPQPSQAGLRRGPIVSSKSGGNSASRGHGLPGELGQRVLSQGLAGAACVH